MMTSIFTENKINELIVLTDISQNKDSLSTYKKYLNLKRKRSPNKQKSGIQSAGKVQYKTKNIFNLSKNKEKAKSTEIKKEEQHPNTIKFQNFSNNIFSIIFSFLRIDDLLKLKNIGSHNIRIYINELFELMKNDNKGLVLNEIICRNNPYINYYDSLNSKKYFLMNGYSKENNNNNNLKNNVKIKYILFHKPTNKYYYLIHNIFNNYFCYSEIDIPDGNKNLEKKTLFKLPGKDYYEKFQFLEEYKQSEVAFFSINKILLYNITTKQKDHCIILNSSCDFVLYKKENKLLIVPNSSNEVEFFKIYNSTSIIREQKYILKVGEKNTENPIILNLNDNINNNDVDEYDSLICVYCRGDKKIFIFDCKLYKIVNEIVSNNNINRVNIDKNYLIAITEQNINYYSFNNKECNFVNSFNLNKICKIENINHISFLNSKYLDNLFILIARYNNQNKYKPILLYLENNTYKKDFYFTLYPMKNDIEDTIYDDELICNSLENKKNGSENKMELNMIVCHFNNKSNNLNSSRNYSSDDIKKASNDRKKNNYMIKEYSVNI